MESIARDQLLKIGRQPWALTKFHRLEENLGAAGLELTLEDLQQIQNALSEIEVQAPDTRTPA